MHAVLAFLSRLRKPAADIVERIGSTWIEAFFAAFIVTAPLNLGLLEDAVIAGTMAAANLAYRLLTAWRPTTTNPWLEFFERVVVTFLTGGIGALLQTGHFGFSDLRAAGLAGLATAFVAVKAGLAKLLGSATASFLGLGGKHEAPQTPAA